MKTWRQIHRTFDRFRQRYYLEAEAPLKVPPPAAHLRWAWANGSDWWGMTHFDEDGDPDLVQLDLGLRRSSRVARLILLHELSHMRNPVANCTNRDRWWKVEAVRLAQLGAFSREEVF